jgi:hypothetical protein
LRDLKSGSNPTVLISVLLQGGRQLESAWSNGKPVGRHRHRYAQHGRLGVQCCRAG